MTNRILIIGATGMLARPVANRLKESGYIVRLFSRSVSENEAKEGYEVVRGDFFNPADLESAMKECQYVHANLGKVDEGAVMKLIVEAARKSGIQTISCISGASVCEENRWFYGTEQKFRQEQAMINSGIPYMIFRPSWFFESLELMVRNGKAMMIGKQPHPYRWIAADDYARLVVTAYGKPKARNQVFHVFGPEYHRMRDLMVRYVKAVHPEIKKVSNVPLWMMKLIGILSGKKEIKGVADLYGYFEKACEQGDSAFTDAMLGKAETTFEKWVEGRK